MGHIEEIIISFITSIREKQRSSRKLLRIEKFENEVIGAVGSARKYNELGGYKEFYEVIIRLKKYGILQDVKNPRFNGKRPRLNDTYWISPKYVENIWNKADIAKVMNRLDLGFYLRQKKYQTEDEWRKILILYQFVKNKDAHIKITREERSLMLFKNEQLPDDIEAEKYLASSHGVSLMNRLKLSPEDLLYKVVHEPFQYWKNEAVPENYLHEVLVVEGLSTYQTLKEVIIRQLHWNFGPIPHYLVWGEGYRICNTLDYLKDITDDPTQLTIRYSGDIDYEGFNIYFDVKSKYTDFNILLAHPFYSFLISFSNEVATAVFKNQNLIEKNLDLLKEEFENHKETFEGIQALWNERKRIAQECINFETLYIKGGFH
ncbi:Wadjet anti-phage system protein JetD domain-containing protein [Bacillus coahuilensis]|uniref:Wadjet anti-phage system protein JetD domain-containing protein n=1 Tax=Bacillus coahuilensis TaxID=408580 RepID=UPI0001850721|nr:Wadjet anti-phage system protein JetD domain-containing protein [Bacillus coahuilensis]